MLKKNILIIFYLGFIAFKFLFQVLNLKFSA